MIPKETLVIDLAQTEDGDMHDRAFIAYHDALLRQKYQPVCILTDCDTGPYAYRHYTAAGLWALMQDARQRAATGRLLILEEHNSTVVLPDNGATWHNCVVQIQIPLLVGDVDPNTRINMIIDPHGLNVMCVLTSGRVFSFTNEACRNTFVRYIMRGVARPADPSRYNHVHMLDPTECVKIRDKVAHMCKTQKVDRLFIDTLSDSGPAFRPPPGGRKQIVII